MSDGNLNFDLKIIKIQRNDVLKNTDVLIQFKELIIKHESMYPSIKNWLKEKVLNGLKSNERVAYIGFNGNTPIISAIVKKDTKSKFCHLSIDEKYQNYYLGDLFFAMMAYDVKDFAKEIHFTLPESLWYTKKEFFQSFGFSNIKKAPSQYRKFENELICSSDYKNVWNNVLLKLPKIINNFSSDIYSGILMSVKPKFAERIKCGNKVVEIRKKFNDKWKGSRITIYSSNPTKALLGYASIENIIKDNPKNIWENYHHSLGCSEKEFFNYSDSNKEIFAIFINNFESYTNPLYLSQIQSLLNKKFSPPQSYSKISTNNEWGTAISIAELLHKRFKYQINK